MAIHALKKITVKDVMKGKPEKEAIQLAVLNEDGTPVLDNENKPVMRTVNVAVAQDVCVIYGRAREHRSGTTSFGTFVEYVGSFEAKRLKDGEIFQSTRVIFPPISADLADADYTRIKRDNPDAEVEMAYVVGVEPDARGSDGYKWSCKPIATRESVSDPLAEMRSSLALSFAAALGQETALKLGFTSGETALNITDQSKPADKEPELIEGTATEVKKTEKAKA